MKLLTVTITARLGRRRATRTKADADARRRDRIERNQKAARAGLALRLQQRLALAYLIEQKIEAGELRNYAEASRLLGVTDARVTQLLDLTLLPIAVQNRILEGKEPVGTEEAIRALRPVAP
jgi:hypothetical protein